MASPTPVLPEVHSTIVPPGFRLPVRLGGLDHRRAPMRSFDAAAGVEELDLGEHRAGRPRGDLAQADERRVADRVEDVRRSTAFHRAAWAWRIRSEGVGGVALRRHGAARTRVTPERYHPAPATPLPRRNGARRACLRLVLRRVDRRPRAPSSSARSPSARPPRAGAPCCTTSRSVTLSSLDGDERRAHVLDLLAAGDRHRVVDAAALGHDPRVVRQDDDVDARDLRGQVLTLDAPQVGQARRRRPPPGAASRPSPAPWPGRPRPGPRPPPRGRVRARG